MRLKWASNSAGAASVDCIYVCRCRRRGVAACCKERQRSVIIFLVLDGADPPKVWSTRELPLAVRSDTSTEVSPLLGRGWAVLWMGSIHWLLCNVLHLLHMVCSSMALHSTSIWRVLLQFRKLSHLELATPCSCHRSSEGHLQRLTAPRGTPTASVAALELASRTPATLLARARTPRMVERQRCRMPSGWPGFVYPQYRPHPRQRRPEGRATDHQEGGAASPGCDEPDPVTSRLA